MESNNPNEYSKEIKNFLELHPNGCKDCFLWDLTAKKYGKRGICEKCFNQSFVSLKSES